MTRAEEIARNVAAVTERMARAAVRSGRDPGSVALLAVSKTKPLEDLLAAYAAGVRAFGENRVQEAEAKFPHLPAGVARHLIGPLQSNKVNKAARLADVVETVDSEGLAWRLDRAAQQAGRRIAVFLEVKTGDEPTKTGVSPTDAPALADVVRALPALDLRGLMTIPPPGETRPHFVVLRELARSLGLPELSMGMSDDFEVAIEEGATLVRVGSALFGTRG